MLGVKTEDLLDIYILYIRSIAEYCSVAFHSSLTIELSDKLERIKKNKLENYFGRYVHRLCLISGNVWSGHSLFKKN